MARPMQRVPWMLGASIAVIVIGMTAVVAISWPRAVRQRSAVMALNDTGHYVYCEDEWVRTAGSKSWWEIAWLNYQYPVTEVNAEHVDQGLLDNICELRDLKSLGIWGESQVDLDYRGLVSLRQLKVAEVPAKAIMHLAECSQLESLAIADQRRLTPDEQAALGRLTSLTYLTAKNFTDEELKWLATLVQLEHLNLKASQLDGDGLLHLQNLPILTALTVENSRVGDRPMADMKLLSRLRVLTLRGSEVSDRGVAALADHPALSSLDVDNTGVGDAGVAALGKLTSLDNLFADGTQVSDAGIAEVCKSPSLSTLHVSKTKVGDGCMAALGRLAMLQDLDISSTLVSDEGIAALARSKSLRNLDVSKTKVGDAGLAVLANVKSLEFLTIKETAVTREGLDAFRQARSDVYVISDY